MKKKLLFPVLLLLSTSIYAQFNIGIKAGLNATKIDNVSFNDKFEYNYLVGGFAEIGLGQTFSVSPEVIFSQASTSLAENADGSIFNTDQAKAKLNFLSIPLLANIRLVGPLNLELGPQYSILINSDENLLKNGENAFKSGDFSVIGGVKIKASRFRVSGRYVVGLDNIGEVNDTDKWKAQAIQLSVGLAF
ncbi:MAG: porin family protein [Niabella sp.]